MKFFIGVPDRISDTLNPIVVKELRQAVHSNFLVVTCALYLGLQLLVLGLVLPNELLFNSFNAGRSIFGGMLMLLQVTCLLFAPAYAGIRLAMERSVENVDLLFITTLRPWSIIWGKFVAALVLTVLLYSVGVPFIAFTYLLRGIDLWSIFSLMAINFVVVAAAIQCAIFIGALHARWVFKLILGMLWLGGLIFVAPSLFGQAVIPGGLLDFGIASRIGSWQFWGISFSVLVVGLTIMGILALLASAAISPLSANRALPVRAFSSVAWLLSGVGAALWSYYYYNIVPIGVWASLSIVLHAIGLFVAVSEREIVGLRMRSSIPRLWPLRPLAFLFYSGAGGGVAWSSVMMILTFMFIGVWVWVFPFMGFPMSGHDFLWRLSTQFMFFLPGAIVSHLMRIGPNPFAFHEIFAALPIFALYAFSYALGASLVRRCFVANRVPSCHTWVIGLALMGFSTTIVPAVLFFYFGTLSPKCLIASPIGPFLYLDVHFHLMNTSALIAIGSALLVGVLNIPWFLGQYRNFQPVWHRGADTAQMN